MYTDLTSVAKSFALNLPFSPEFNDAWRMRVAECTRITKTFVSVYTGAVGTFSCHTQFAQHVLLLAKQAVSEIEVFQQLKLLCVVCSRRPDLTIYHLIQLHAHLQQLQLRQILMSIQRLRQFIDTQAQ